MKKLLLILFPFTCAAQDTIRMRIPVADTSKITVTQTFINGYEVYKTAVLGGPAKLVATLDAKKKPIGKPYIKTGAGIPVAGFLWADSQAGNTLNPLDAAQGLTITGNTMQGNPPNGWALVRTVLPVAAHTEFYINYMDNANIGLTSSLSILTEPLGVYGYCYDAIGNKESASGVLPYGIQYKTGDYVDMYYNNGSVSFSVNGVSQGIAFTNVPAGLFVTIGTSQKTIITVKFDQFVYE